MTRETQRVRAERLHIRPEEQRDHAAIYRVVATAFETHAEADLVNELRAQAIPVISLVAVCGESIIGHIMFSAVELDEHPELRIMGLAPMAVAPAHQRSGIGSALVRAGLEHCRAAGYGAVVVLGHPTYYPRFAFTPAKRFGIRSEYEVPDDAFMAIELQPEYLRGSSGTVKYHEVFANVS